MSRTAPGRAPSLLDSFNYAQLFEEILPAVRDNVAGEMIMLLSARKAKA